MKLYRDLVVLFAYLLGAARLLTTKMRVKFLRSPKSRVQCERLVESVDVGSKQ